MKNLRGLSLFCACAVILGSASSTSLYAAETEEESTESAIVTETNKDDDVVRIHYDLGGGFGRIEEADPVNPGEAIMLSPWALRKDGFSHVGWTDGTKEYKRGVKISMPMNDLYLRPVWKKVYFVRYEKLEPYGYSSPYQDGTVSPGTKIDLPNLPMHNDTAQFNGWLVNGVHYDPLSSFTMPEENVQVDVDWQWPVKLDYYAGDVEGVIGSGHYIVDKFSGYNINLSNSERLFRVGYKLTGWYDPDEDKNYDLEASYRMPDRDVTMLAVWSPLKVSMKFNANGGEGKMSNQIEVFDTSASIKECEYTKEGYKLHGWLHDDEYYMPGANVHVKIAEMGEFMNFKAIWIEEDRNPGDLNRDGVIDISDLSILALHIVGDNVITDEKLLDDADVEYDGNVDLSDLARMKQFLMQKKILLGMKGE